jgi:hypothetical protein
MQWCSANNIGSSVVYIANNTGKQAGVGGVQKTTVAAVPAAAAVSVAASVPAAAPLSAAAADSAPVAETAGISAKAELVT